MLITTPDSRFKCMDPKMANLLTNLKSLKDAYLGINEELIHGGDVCFDIGANIGTFSTLAARLSSPGGKVFAFEPCEEIRDLLLENIELNHVSDAVSIQSDVVSDALGYFSVKKAPKNMGATRFIESDVPQEDLFTSTTLDLWIENHSSINRCDFIKIDVEGMEIKVLKSAVNTLKKYQPILYIEICQPHYEKYGFTVSQLEQFLKELGYHFFRYFGPNVRRILSLTQGATFYNLIAIHPEQSRYPQKHATDQQAFLLMLQEKLTTTYSQMRHKYPLRTKIKNLFLNR